MDICSKIDFYFSDYVEKDWINFSQCFEKVKIPNDVIGKAPDDVLYALIGLLGVDSMRKWIGTELRELDFNTPIELVKTYKGLGALKALIMRMPS